MVVEWEKLVNKNILDNMSITIGGKGYVQDKSNDGGYKDRRLVRRYVPEEYKVSMDFNWAEKYGSGTSEFTIFMDWYNDIHKRGVNPFLFPSIRRYKKDLSKELCRYRITSSPTVQKHGLNNRVQMTWIEDYPGHLYIPRIGSEWLDTVNKRILESTTFTPSSGGKIDFSGANGEFSDRRLSEEYVPNQYSVSMDFDWLNLDSNGQSEFDRFVDWYIYGHKYGVNAFTFPAIDNVNSKGCYRCYYLASDGQKTFITESAYILGKTSADKDRYFRVDYSDTQYDKYRITSALTASKSGFCMRVAMTWENVVTREFDIDSLLRS